MGKHQGRFFCVFSCDWSLFPRGSQLLAHRGTNRFSLQREVNGRRVSKQESACRYGEGDWRMIKA